MLTSCPRCSATLTTASACQGCGLGLVGPEACQLRQVDQRIADVDRRIAALRAERRDLWVEHIRLVVAMSGSTPVQASPYRDVDLLPVVPAPPLRATMAAWRT